ncbi:MAG: xanthine dehydrogenase family protein subunit M [Acidimicrobiia bacterium]|nr:xanthine dehydrogenase family protein subunit M [Acidimicrobiia bacterium]
MTLTRSFTYVKPGSLDEALALLAEHGRAAAVLAGGTDLISWMRDDLVAPEVVVDIKGLPGLEAITLVDGTLRLGALATFSDVLRSPVVSAAFPVLAEMAGVVASVGIRNRATVAGNLCSAVPSNDAGPVLLAADALVQIAATDGERTIPLAEWFRGPRRTALRGGELVTRITVPLPDRHGGCYLKLGRYRGEDLAQASVAVLALPGDHYRIAFGAVAPATVRAAAIEESLEGRPLDEATLAAAADLVPEVISPISDLRASAGYRTHMCRVMLRRALRAAAERLADDGPPYGERLL